MQNKNVILIAFYNKKALGVRYLETALRSAGYSVHTVFFKDFNSIHPRAATDAELKLLQEHIQKLQPIFAGLSVMSSMYLETVDAVIEMIQKNTDLPIICGGAFATLSPEYFLNKGVQAVIRSDGEKAICAVAEAILNKTDFRHILSVSYIKDSDIIHNEIGGLENDIDAYGIPTVNSLNACFIDNDRLIHLRRSSA